MIVMKNLFNEMEDNYGKRDSIFGLVMYIQYIAEMMPKAETMEEMQRRLLMINDLAGEIAKIEGLRLLEADLDQDNDSSYLV